MTARPHRWIPLLAAALLLQSCATSPLGRSQLKLFSDDDMAQMGVAAFAQTAKQTPLDGSGQTNAFVSCVARAVTQVAGYDASWDVKVFRSDEVNAFALPGGKIGVYSGLFKVVRNQDQLAAVLAHEVSHVVAGHGNERMSQQYATQGVLGVVGAIAGDDGSGSGGLAEAALGLGAQYGILLPFSRAQESEADLLGLDFMSRAGFDPRQAVVLWQNMSQLGGKPPELLSDHPSDTTRIAQIEQRLPQDLPLYEQARAAGRKPQCGAAPAA
ncbi:MAG: M48 family metallopeptidase [Nevskia sp.]|nr:M48 family metallopeptidase [Nevskia sp.]